MRVIISMNSLVFLMNDLSNMSSMMAEAGQTGDNKLSFQETTDQDSSWSLVNLHHGPTFKLASMYFSGLFVVLLIALAIAYLFCCGGARRCLSNLTVYTRNTAATLLSAHQSLLPQAPAQYLPVHYNPQAQPMMGQHQQPITFGSQSIPHPVI